MVLASICVRVLLYPTLHPFVPRLGQKVFINLLYKPYFPLQIGVALAAGFLLKKRYGHEAVLWAWVLPAIIFLYKFLSWSGTSVLETAWSARLSWYFGTACQPPNCFDQLDYTSTLYSSIAYSLGGLLSTSKLTSRIVDEKSPLH